MSRIIRPNMTRTAIGSRTMQTHSTKFVHEVGFSNGWAEFGPKKPPPLVPSCLIATTAATGPRAIPCVLGVPSSFDPIAPAWSVTAEAFPSNVIGTPPRISSTPTTMLRGSST